MDHRFPSPRARRLCLLATGLLLGAACPLPARAAAPANPELENMLSRLPDPARWKESPLQDALDPATHDPDLQRVSEALRKKKSADALRLMRVVAARYPAHPVIQILYGRLALSLRSYAEAEKAFVAVAADPKSAAVGWYYAGEVQFLEHRPRDAAGSMRRCLRANPPAFLGVRAWTALAYADILGGNHAEAVSASRQATRLAPTSAIVWVIRGFCEADARQQQAAVADYRKAISLDRRLGIAYEGLGSAYVQTDRPGEAIAPLKTALSLSPRNYFTATELGYCYLRTGQPAAGVKACRQAVAARPDFSSAWDVLGLCYEQLGNTREALAAFQQAVKTGPGDGTARAHLDQAARASGGAARNAPGGGGTAPAAPARPGQLTW